MFFFGPVLGLSLLWSWAATNAADATSAPAEAAEEAEQGDVDAVLEFRIAPRRPSFRGPSPLTKQEIDKCTKDLTENGPTASMERDDRFVWMKIMPGVALSKNNPHLITEEYQSADYLLVHNWPPSVMSSEMGWGLKRITKDTKDNMGRPAIGFQFDWDGADRFYYLTSANVGRSLAIVIEGKVVSAPSIESAIRSQAVITGDFTTEQIDDMTKALEKIVRPISTTAAPVTRRAVRIYLIPVLIFVMAVTIVGFLVYR
ncbi:MAG: hypothetical protein JSW59_01900 [Phycisphaerales bacterium]|nr:MAG: hypothetical protein JSW59_01900 [Phycisphaerales bacterium]